MKLFKMFLLFCLIVCVCGLSLTGCVTIKRTGETTVFADTALKPVLDKLSDMVVKQDNVVVHLRYGSSEELEGEIKQGKVADLLIFGGYSESPQGSLTFGAPAIRSLLVDQLIDNYQNIAIGSDRQVYSVAKLKRSKDYVDAQTFVDFIRSKVGKKVFAQNGFQV